MTNAPTPGPSGSRWEPAPDPASTDAHQPEPPDGVPPDEEAPEDRQERRRERRRRAPFLALLIAVLALGTASAGVALARAQDSGVVDPGSGASSAPPDPRGGPGVGGPHGPGGDGHHGRGGADRPSSGQGDQDGPDNDQPAAPSAGATT